VTQRSHGTGLIFRQGKTLILNDFLNCNNGLETHLQTCVSRNPDRERLHVRS
jgi:hypothetical protein